MKLSSIKSILDNALPFLETLTSQNTQNSTLKFSGLNNFKRGILELKKIDVFDDQIAKIESSSIFTKTNDVADVVMSEGKIFRERARELFNGVHMLSNSLEKVVEDNEERDQNSIYIKLPHTKDLEELAKEIQAFNKILSLTILDAKINGEITLESVEPGSVWLKVYVRSAMAVSLIGSLTWSSAVVYKKIQEGKMVEQYVIQKKLQNEQRKNAIDAAKLMTDIVIDAEAEHLYHNYYENGEIDNEQMERLKLSIKMLSEEIYKGAEVNPALTAPENVANLFPDMKALPSIQSKVKQIEQ